MNLRALSPFGPIFGKELRTTARRKRTYVLRFLYLGLLLLVMWSIYLSERPRYFNGYEGGVARRAQQAASLGHAFFAGFSIFCIFSLALISPVLTATSISSERMGKTLHVLLMTPITSWQIVSGKLLSRLLAAFTLLGLSLPVLAVVRLLGGVDLDRMLWAIALCLVTSLFTAAIGLFFSTFMNRAYAVILLSYATLLFLYIFVPMILVLMFAPRRVNLGFYQFMAAINPIAVMVVGIAFGERPFRGISPIPTIVVHLIGTLLLVMWSGLVLRRMARREGERAGKGVPDSEPTSEAALLAMPPSGVVPRSSVDEPLSNELATPLLPPMPLSSVRVEEADRPGRKIARTVSDNPVLWRELRRPLTSRRWQAITFTLITLGLLFLTYFAVANDYHNALGKSEVQIAYASAFCGLWTMLACVLSATAIAGEKESDTWTLLLATPISAKSIVLGKLAGQFRRLLWPTILIVSHFAIFTLFGVISIPCLLVILWVLFSFNVIWIAMGVYFSLRFRRVTTAVILNLLMPIMAYLLVPLILKIIESLASTDSNGRMTEAFLWYVPYQYFSSAIDGFEQNRRYFWLPNNHSNVNAGDFVTAVFGVGVIYLAISGCIVVYTIRRFNGIVGRATQRS